MTAHDVRQANQALLDTAARLVDELHDVPAGRVLRCFSRAVGHVCHGGYPPGRPCSRPGPGSARGPGGRFVPRPRAG